RMRATLRRGDVGPDVSALQRLLGVSVDGVFGPATEAAVLSFQGKARLYADGIVGPVTWAALEEAPQKSSVLPCVKVACDVHGKGYGHLTVRQDGAPHLEAVRDKLHHHGAILTSSGGLRSLSADVGANRSATSLHYLGRAIDLYLYSGMVDPRVDPYVCTL